MKKNTLVTLILLLTQLSFSQTMTVYNKDRTKVEFSLSQVDSITFSASATNQVLLFQEDFEGYSANTFPSSGGWVLRHNGAGDSYQVVTNAQHRSGNKSMQLRGSRSGWWAAHMYKSIQFTQSPIFAEVWLMASASPTGDSEDIGRFLFYDLSTSQEWPGTYLYPTNGTIKCHIGGNEQTLVSFTANQWYKIKMKLDYARRSISVWINDLLIAQDVTGTFSSNSWNCFMLGAEHGNTTFYFDDIKVWTE